MSNDNQIDFTVRIKREGVGELADDLAKIEESAKDVSAAGADAGAALDKLGDAAQQAATGVDGLVQATSEAADQGGELGSGTDTAAQAVQELGQGAQTASKGVAAVGQAASQAGSELDELRKATEAKTAAIKSGLQVEQSEIELQRRHLEAARAEQQARMQAAQAQGDEAAATRAGNALRQIEGDQLALVARAKRAEATAVQQAVDARRQELAAIGPLTQAQANELRAAENHARALRVEAAAADQAAARSRDLTTAHQGNAAATDQLGARVQGLSLLLGQMAGALGAAFTFRELVGAAAQMEQLRSGLTAVTQDAAKAGEELEFVRVVAARIGADVTEVGRAFLSLAASTRGTAVEGEPTRQVFEAVATAMGKAGKSSAETSLALQALSQMASKGTVQMEELRGQLGEQLPGALNAAAKGLGITTAELIKLVEEGKVTAQDLFPALAKGLNELYGGAPAAQTLSQEITNIKNAVTDMSARIGDAGGLRVLKVGAELAQAAVVLLGEGLVATGQKIGVLMGALATLDFSGVKQAFADIEAEARKSLLNAAQHNDVLRASLGAVGNEATKAALAAQQSAQATASSGAAAAQAGDDWIKLNNGYRLVLESVREQLTLAEKEVAAAKARGDAAIAEAKLLGDEAAVRKAVGQAAADEAAALANLATKRKAELDTLEAQFKRLQEEAAARGKVSAERTKELSDLEQLIAKKRIEVDTARAQAAAAQDLARAKGEEVQAAQAAVSAAQAATTARVADARASVSLFETQKALAAQGEQLARLMGDENAARRFRIEQLQIDIKLTQAKAEVQRAEAEGSIAVANAMLAEMRARGENNSVKEAELRASIKLAEAKLKEADAIDKSTRVTKQAIENLRLFGREAGQAGEHGHGAGERVAAGWKSAAGAIGSASQALQDYQQRMKEKYGRPGEGDPQEQLGEGVQKVGSGYRNKDGFTSDAKGNVQQQFVWTRSTIIDYLKQSGLDEQLAARLSEQFLQSDGTVGYKASAAQLQWGGKYSTLAEALGKMAEYYKYNDSGKHEAAQMLEYERTKNSARPTSTPAAPGRSSSGGVSGSSSGASYVSNITINGQRRTVNFADRQSQMDGEALIRALAEGKGVAQ